MNVVVMTGNATKEVELRFNSNGTAIANGTIAVRRDFKNQQGEYETDFFNFVVMGKLAEIIANHVKKGDKFGIKGKLQNRVWESDNGKKYFTEVFVDGFDFPSKANNRQQENRSDSQRSTQSQGYTRVEEDPFAGNGQIDIDDSDLPF